MRRLSTSILAGLLLVGLVAAPAAADRTVENGNFPHYSFVYAGDPEVMELPTGEWAEFGAGWGTMTEAQRDDFVASTVVEIECDGVSQDVSLFLPFDTLAYHSTLLEPGKAHSSQDCSIRATFIKDHWDGFDLYPKDTVLESTRTIVWIPRGQFPS